MSSKRIALLPLVFLLVFISLVSCSKEKSAEPQTNSDVALLIQKVPAAALGFMAFNFADGGIQEYLNNPAYKSYMSGMVTSLNNNPELKGGFGTYTKVMEALGFIPKQDKFLPYSGGLFYFTVGENQRANVAGYYKTAKGVNARTVLEETKTVIKEKNTVTDFSGTGYNGFSVKPFEGMDATNPAVTIYKDKLHVDEIFLAASDDLIVLATDKSFVDRAYTQVPDESKAMLESASYKKAMSELGDRSNEMGYGYVDLATLGAKTGAKADMPLKAAAFSASIKGSLFSNAVVLADVNDPKVEPVLAALASGTDGAPLAKAPKSSALAIGLDGKAINRAFEASEESKNNPALASVKEVLGKIATLTVGVRPPAKGEMYPDVYIVAGSSDAAALKALVKQQMANTPLPPNITWQTKEENGLSIDFIPSPFGIGAYMASLKDSLVITSNEAALKEIATAGSDALLQGNELIKIVEKAAKSPVIATYISYQNFVTLMSSFASTMQMFAPQQAGIDPQQYDYMKHMGEVAIMGRYDPGVLRISFGQMLPK